MSDILNQVAARLQEKIANSERSVRCGRIDFALADYEMVDEHGAEIMVSFAPELGEPTNHQLGEWVATTLDGVVKLVPASVRLYRDENAAVLRAQRDVPVVPLKYKAEMLHVGGVRYVDKSKAVWEVTEAENGDKVLTRIANDDIEAMLSERLSRQRAGRYAHAQTRLSQLRKESALTTPEKGDRVLFIDNGISQMGDVISIGADKIKIKSGSETLNLDRGAVVDVLEKAPANIKKEDKDLAKFWKEIYGPDFPVDQLKRK